jgi:hypothetical protein
MNKEQWWNVSETGKPKNSEKGLCRYNFFFNRNSTWLGLPSFLGLFGDKPVNNHLSRGTANGPRLL